MDYIKWIRKSEKRFCAKVLFWCALIFFLGAFIAFCNTRFNGFADVKPFSHYYGIAAALFEKLYAVLSQFYQRFLH